MTGITQILWYGTQTLGVYRVEDDSKENAMNTLNHPSLASARIAGPAHLAHLMLDHAWGLARAAQSPALQELCFSLGDHFSGLAEGKAPTRGIAGLLPILLSEASTELKERGAKAQDFKVLLAARLIWASPALGEQGLRVAQKAWLRAWKGQAGAEAFLQSL